MKKWLVTEGEFKADIGFDEDRGRYSTQIYVEGDSNVVAMVYGNSVDECEANAKLFAASKDLLLACSMQSKIISQLLKGITVSTPEVIKTVEFTNDIINKAR